MGAVESGGGSDRWPASPCHLSSLSGKSKSRTDLETCVILASEPMTRCNALPNVDTGCESEIIPYLLVGVILSSVRSGGTQ
jgi:hypothetical protein